MKENQERQFHELEYHGGMSRRLNLWAVGSSVAGAMTVGVYIWYGVRVLTRRDAGSESCNVAALLLSLAAVVLGGVAHHRHWDEKRPEYFGTRLANVGVWAGLLTWAWLWIRYVMLGP